MNSIKLYKTLWTQGVLLVNVYKIKNSEKLCLLYKAK